LLGNADSENPFYKKAFKESENRNLKSILEQTHIYWTVFIKANQHQLYTYRSRFLFILLNTCVCMCVVVFKRSPKTKKMNETARIHKIKVVRKSWQCFVSRLRANLQ
jgi:hypothetical protein